MTFSVTGRHHGASPTGILTLAKQPPDEAVRFAADLKRSGMIVTIEDDDTGDAVSLEALSVLAESIALRAGLCEWETTALPAES